MTEARACQRCWEYWEMRQIKRKDVQPKAYMVAFKDPEETEYERYEVCGDHADALEDSHHDHDFFLGPV